MAMSLFFLQCLSFNDILLIHQIKDSAANLKTWLLSYQQNQNFTLQTDESIDKIRPAILFIFI